MVPSMPSRIGRTQGQGNWATSSLHRGLQRGLICITLLQHADVSAVVLLFADQIWATLEELTRLASYEEILDTSSMFLLEWKILVGNFRNYTLALNLSACIEFFSRATVTSLWSLWKDLASLYLPDLLAAVTVGHGVPPARNAPLPHALFVPICLAASSLAPSEASSFCSSLHSCEP